MKKLIYHAVFGFCVLTANRSVACNPGCGARPAAPVPGVMPPVPANAQPAPRPSGGQTTTGVDVVWDLPAEEKARIRAAAKIKPVRPASVQTVRRP